MKQLSDELVENVRKGLQSGMGYHKGVHCSEALEALDAELASQPQGAAVGDAHPEILVVKDDGFTYAWIVEREIKGDKYLAGTNVWVKDAEGAQWFCRRQDAMLQALNSGEKNWKLAQHAFDLSLPKGEMKKIAEGAIRGFAYDLARSRPKVAAAPTDAKAKQYVPVRMGKHGGLEFIPQDDAKAALCEDCPPLGYPTDETRCSTCPRRGSVPDKFINAVADVVPRTLCTADAIRSIDDAKADGAVPECKTCHGTGDITRLDGEWVGYCPECGGTGVPIVRPPTTRPAEPMVPLRVLERFRMAEQTYWQATERLDADSQIMIDLREARAALDAAIESALSGVGNSTTGE